MSAKNRAFALAVATAAIVGMSAPVASAASNPSGFNNDSIVDVSGNQLSGQACNNDIPVNAGVLAGQVPLSDISALLGILNSGNASSSVTRSCTQDPSQMVSTTTTTNSTSTDPAGSDNSGKDQCGCDHSGMNNSGGMDHSGMKGSEDPADQNTSGFNNDSIINTSNNQVPIQVCNNDVPVNAGLGVLQVPVDGLSGAAGLLSSGSITSSVTRTCTQNPTQNNPSTTTATSSSNG